MNRQNVKISSVLTPCHSGHVEPVLFCAFLFVTGLTLTSIQPTNVEKSLLHPASFQKQFSGHVPTLFSPRSLRLLRNEARACSSRVPPSILHSRALLPASSSGLSWPAAESTFFTSFGQTHLMPILTSPSNIKAQITGPAHHCSCRSSFLLPRLFFLNSLHPRFTQTCQTATCLVVLLCALRLEMLHVHQHFF